MSQLRDRIAQAARRRGGTIGFGAARREAAGRCLLVLAQGTGDPLLAALDHPVDGALIDDPSRLAETVAAAGGRPVGLLSPGATATDAAGAADAGADFLSIDDTSAHAAALLDERLGAVVRVAPPLTEDELVLLRGARFDALIVPATPRPVTVRAQLELRRIAALAQTPLLIEVGDAPDTETLRVWRDAGVQGVIAQGTALGQLPALLAAADAVPPPRTDAADAPAVGSSGAAFGLR